MSSADSASSTKARDEGEESRRDRILQAAEDEFAHKGFAAVRMDEITRLAGVNKQLIYYYFGSKAGLYDAVLERMIDSQSRFWDELAAADYATALGMLTSMPATAKWERLISWEGTQFHQSDGRIRQLEIRRARYAIQSDIFRKAQGSGELDPRLDAEMMSILVAALQLSRATLPQVVKLATGLEPDGQEYALREHEFVLTLMGALAPKSSGGSQGE